MEPLEIVVLTAMEMGSELGLTSEEVAQRITARMSKQNRYKWKKKIFAIMGSAASSAACPFTGNFLDEMGL